MLRKTIYRKWSILIVVSKKLWGFTHQFQSLQEKFKRTTFRSRIFSYLLCAFASQKSTLLEGTRSLHAWKISTEKVIRLIRKITKYHVKLKILLYILVKDMLMLTYHFLLDQEIVLDKNLLKWKRKLFFLICLEDWTLNQWIKWSNL